ncbi:3-oxoacyl-[acyl-carrier-protein] synthase III C-terminal domain-containing protein [Nocardia spumae]|uniref:3-oxoacyl-[acyl-carrier-protein] synthase III C-terminal domain-containing protein n=1 Tax=Nocardia spumae TaxID=2887190 RepID=UPI001D15D9FC|nr:3-oxoacyl-[acyl-carrier-protein] synthase III C-terminal domain-containing protein [Nocardia spumae]
MNVYLHGIAYAVGAREPIASLPPLRADPALLRDMRGLGLNHYCRAEQSPLELAAEVVSATLARVPVDAAEIDLLIYATSSPESGTLAGGEFLRFCERFGLTRATPIGVTLAECANFGSALRIAHSLVAAGSARNVLVITADACPDPDARILRDAVSVLSDGAASCLITSAHPSRIEVLGANQGTNQLIRVATMPALAGLTKRGLSRAVADMLDRAGLDRGDVRRIIANNVNEEAVRFMAESAGLEHDLCYLDNVGDYAHVHSADNLINLQTYLEDGVAPGEVVMTISHGFGTWGVALLRIC